MKLADAKLIAEKAVAGLQPFCERLEIAGSIRRGKQEVGDIDIVTIPKRGFYPCDFGFDVEFSEEKIWENMIPTVLKGWGAKVYASGPELLHCNLPGGVQMDLYRARRETWGVILLVRTGSKEHNVKLCMIAKSRGLKLSASDGVIMVDAPNQADATQTVIASRSEEDIFAVLGLAYVDPKLREALP